MPDEPILGESPSHQTRWTAVAQWSLAGSLALFLSLLAWRGLGLEYNRSPPTTIERGKVLLHTLDLNTARDIDLRLVPGLGSTLVARILDHRTVHGPFRSVEDLRQVHGIGPATLERIRPYLRVDGQESPKPVIRAARPELEDPPGKKKPPGELLNPNDATQEQLLSLPGIGPTLAGRIIARRQEERFRTIEDLRKVKGIGVKTLDRIRPFLRIDP